MSKESNFVDLTVMGSDHKNTVNVDNNNNNHVFLEYKEIKEPIYEIDLEASINHKKLDFEKLKRRYIINLYTLNDLKNFLKELYKNKYSKNTNVLLLGEYESNLYYIENIKINKIEQHNYVRQEITPYVYENDVRIDIKGA